MLQTLDSASLSAAIVVSEERDVLGSPGCSTHTAAANCGGKDIYSRVASTPQHVKRALGALVLVQQLALPAVFKELHETQECTAPVEHAAFREDISRSGSKKGSMSPTAPRCDRL